MEPSREPIVTKAVRYDEWLVPTNPHLLDLAQSLYNELEANTPSPALFHPKTAARKLAMVQCLIANFALLIALNGSEASLIISAKNGARTRYQRSEFAKKAFMGIVRGLESLGYIVRHPGIANKVQTTLKPSESLLALFPKQPHPHMVSRLEGAETIWLMCGSKKNRKPVNYSDTPRTNTMRAEMETINASYRDVEITLHGNPQGPVHLVRMFRTGSPDEERFDSHGRIFGGFWHYLPRVQRQGIKLNGRPIAELDFSSMFPRLAYLAAGEIPPDGDLYADIGLPREAAKVAMAALLWRNGPMRRLPDKLKEVLGPGWNGNRVTAALALKHPTISNMFGTSCGLHLAYLKSQILVPTLLKLINRDIVTLPLHDGLLCEKGHEAECRSAMEDASEEFLGTRLPVGIK
ncbi:hypothetical protein [Roseibium album]|uniref:hypothetical protein n=1 Tax=Roseibium album TaxID=311410 RepID=UPI0032984A09